MSFETQEGVETEPRHREQVAAAVLDLANREESVLQTEKNHQTAAVPHHPTDSWALQGTHPGWLGFDGKTGEPK